MNRSIAMLLVLAGTTASVQARPLITEEPSTIGKQAFEAGFQLWRRIDTFGTPQTDYKTIGFPVRVRIGLARWLDVGLRLDQYTQNLTVNGHDYSGSQNGLLSPEIKIAPFENAGLLFIWHKSAMEKERQDLPIARGNDYEALALARLPLRWPITLNAGYLFRESYRSTLGVDGTAASTVHPGNVFESNAAIEVPLKWHFALVGEAAYYRFDSEKINSAVIHDSSGEAANALAGLVWTYGGWHIGAGADFGLLKERHSSFDLERGAGDSRVRFSMSYRLKPKKPVQ